MMMMPAFHHQNHDIPVLKTIASQKTGIEELYEAIVKHAETTVMNDRKSWLLTEKAWHLIQQKRMKDLSKAGLKLELEKASADPGFNFYRFVDRY